MCAVVLATIGAIGGAARQVSYTSASTLQVGKVNPNSPGFYGFVQSASDLATVFSRAITAAPVLEQIQRRLGLSPGDASEQLSAEPIPSSPAFRVIATGTSPREAIRLADVTSQALIAYEAHANTYNPDTRRLLREYRAASLNLARATTQAREVARQRARQPSSPAVGSLLERAQAAQAAASLQAQALASNYQLSAQSTTSGLLSLVAGAVTASSNRSSQVQLLGFVGLAGGLVIGCALAVLLERRPALSRSRLGSPRS